MSVILSIKPEYVEKIQLRTKRYEFRKQIPKKDVSKVYIYSSSPIKKIIGYFVYSDVLVDKPERIWCKCKEYAGIDEQSFFKYFKNNSKGYAIKIKNLAVLDNPIDPKEIMPNFYPPQSFMYVDDDLIINNTFDTGPVIPIPQ